MSKPQLDVFSTHCETDFGNRKSELQALLSAIGAILIGPFSL